MNTQKDDGIEVGDNRPIPDQRQVAELAVQTFAPSVESAGYGRIPGQQVCRWRMQTNKPNLLNFGFRKNGLEDNRRRRVQASVGEQVNPAVVEQTWIEADVLS